MEKKTFSPPEIYPTLKRSYVKKFFFVKNERQNDRKWFLRKRPWILIIFSPCIFATSKCRLSTPLGIAIGGCGKRRKWMVWFFQIDCSQVRETKHLPQTCFCLRTFALAVFSAWNPLAPDTAWLTPSSLRVFLKCHPPHEDLANYPI